MANKALTVTTNIFPTGGTSGAHIGYRFYKSDGTASGARITTGVWEIGSSGVYGVASPTIPGDACGVLWDDDRNSTLFAWEGFDYRLPEADAGTTGGIPTAVQNADALLLRNFGSLTVTDTRCALNALRFLRNKWSLSGTTLTVTAEDDTTSAWTSVVTTNAAATPVTGSDPV